jgi:3-oxoacyl-[acyl-carrier-protein] synthase III
VKRRVCIAGIGASLPGFRLLRRGSVARAVEAGRRCLAVARRRPAEVGLLIHAGVTRDHHVCEPANAAYIQHRLGINVEFQGARTLSFDLVNGGCGMLDAAHVLCSLLQAGTPRCGMVTASEGNADWRAKGERPCPDSGAAVLLELSPRLGTGFGSFAFLTRSEHADMAETVVSLSEARGRLQTQRDPGLEERWLEMAGPVVDEVLKKEGLSRGQIDRVIPAQISTGFLARLPQAVGVPAERLADFSSELPDTLSTAPFLALQREWRLRPPAAGQTVLLLAFGSGLTVAAATYHF